MMERTGARSVIVTQAPLVRMVHPCFNCFAYCGLNIKSSTRSAQKRTTTSALDQASPQGTGTHLRPHDTQWNMENVLCEVALQEDSIMLSHRQHLPCYVYI
jgi:hypothetical protein